MINKVMSMLRNLIKRSETTLVVEDTLDFQTVQVSYLSKTAEIENILPYGLCSSAPIGSIAVMFNIQGQEENRAGMANLTRQRFKDLKEGEVVVGNYLTKSFVKFKADGSIQVFSAATTDVVSTGDINIKAPNVNIKGNLSVTGSTSLAATVTSNSVNISDTHVHGKNNVDQALTDVPQ